MSYLCHPILRAVSNSCFFTAVRDRFSCLRSFYFLGLFAALCCKVLSCTVLCCTVLSCTTEQAPAGRILLRNDSLDKQFADFTIDQLTTAEGSAGFRATLSPGEKTLLPRGVTTFRLTRKYRDHSKIYKVRCEAKLSKGMIIRLIDIHSGRLAGDCKLVRKGELDQNGNMNWEDS